LLIGESVYQSSGGAIRDMHYPKCFSNPSRTTSDDYYCGAQDNGGVHTNSGVINRLYVSMVDGIKYNRENSGKKVNVKGLGMTKALYLVFTIQF
jgi:Zn-dependent metalloprotease